MSSSDDDRPTTVSRNSFLMLGGEDGGNSTDDQDGGHLLSSEMLADPAPAMCPPLISAPKSDVVLNEIDILLTELDLNNPPVASSKKTKKKRHDTVANSISKTNELCDDRCQIQIVSNTVPAISPTTSQQLSKGGIDDLLAELETLPVTDESESKKKKRLRKKKKEPESISAPIPSKHSAAIIALKQRLEAEKRAEEEYQRQEEERIRRHDDMLRQEAEEAKRREEERLRRAEEKKQKQQELRRQGKLLTKGQKAKASKNASYIEQLRAQGLIPNKSERPVNEGKLKAKKKAKKLTQKERMLAEMKAAIPDAGHEEYVLPEPEPCPILVQHECGLEAESELMPEEHNMSEASSSSVIPDWDMDSDDARHEKETRRAERQKPKTQRGDQGLVHQSETVLESRKQQRSKAPDVDKPIERDSLKQHQPSHRRPKTSHLSVSESVDCGQEPVSPHDRPKIDICARHEKRKETSFSESSLENLRSPICCVLGHVDTGKTKILDKIRRTKVQDGEAGGITQQIGASYIPMSSIIEKTTELNALQKKQLDYKLPGLLIIDTPGHESFTNLRSRGSSLCDIAILVVDIMHGLEPQTKESLQLLRQKKTPFVVALNKVDRIYGWKPDPWAPFTATLSNQPKHTVDEFEERVRNTVAAFAETGLNCALYYRNADFRKNVSLVPTSAISGEGLPDLLMLLVQLCQHMMSERLQYISELQCTVLEVKLVDGIGTTIDVILSNGCLHVNDTIVVCGLHGPIVTTIRALLTPYPMTELRVKGDYQRLKVVKAAAGIKIAASGLEDAIAGSQLLVAGPDDEIEDLKDEVMTDLATILSKVDKSGRGVYVQASTLGSLEALLQFLSDMSIPVSGIGIGPVHKKDVSKASIMVDKQPEYAVILAFDVKVSAEARQHAQDRSVRIFSADIIYHLFDQFIAYMKEIQNANQTAAENIVVMPCILEIMPDCIFCRKDPILIGVIIKEGILRRGTPLCAHDKIDSIIGEVTGMELNHKEISEAKAGHQVCIKIEPKPGHVSCTYGRQFNHDSLLLSKITRQSIDTLKANFKDYLSQDDWKCVIKLKKIFNIL